MIIDDYKRLDQPVCVEDFEALYMTDTPTEKSVEELYAMTTGCIEDHLYQCECGSTFLSGSVHECPVHLGWVAVGEGTPIQPPTEQPETTIERQVDAVIDHLGKGRVVPRKVDELAGAVARARTDGAVGRAIGGSRGIGNSSIVFRNRA